MFKKIYKIMPLALIELVAPLYCEKFRFSGMIVVSPFEGVILVIEREQKQ